MKQKLIIIALLLGITSTAMTAQILKRDKWECKVFAGYNLGGTSPLPLPAEIRKINSWNPRITGTVAFHVTRWITPDWGLTTGLAIDVKGMKISADVKYMYTRLEVGEGDNTGIFSGTFSGKNETTVQNGYIVLPLLATWRPKEAWTFRLGGYFATCQSRKFEGSASDGYIRSGGPTYAGGRGYGRSRKGSREPATIHSGLGYSRTV